MSIIVDTSQRKTSTIDLVINLAHKSTQEHTFRPCFKVLQTDRHLLYRVYADKDNTTIRDNYSPLNPDGQASITVHGHQLSAAHTVYSIYVYTASVQQLSAKSSLFACRLLPVQNCNSWSTVLKPADVITLYQFQPTRSYVALVRTLSYEQSILHCIRYIL